MPPGILGRNNPELSERSGRNREGRTMDERPEERQEFTWCKGEWSPGNMSDKGDGP